MSEEASSAAIETLATGVSTVGLAMAAAGGVAWLTVRSQISAERIVVPGAAQRFAGRQVKGPFTALEQAETIKRLAAEATGGKTYGELDADDPAAETALKASLLRASLYTSVMAFGVAASQVATGASLVAVGTALRRLARRH